MTADYSAEIEMAKFQSVSVRQYTEWQWIYEIFMLAKFHEILRH